MQSQGESRLSRKARLRQFDEQLIALEAQLKAQKPVPVLAITRCGHPECGTAAPAELPTDCLVIDLGCKYAIPLMRAHGLGSIINISSIAGIIASGNYVSYNTAKAAVRHISKSIALHCAKGGQIRCNSVHPVFINTPILDRTKEMFGEEEALAKLGRQIPLGKVGEPDDIAYAVLYLASDESKLVTGIELKVDGGISAM